MKNQVNIFDRTLQAGDADSRIIVALERVAESFRVLLWGQAKQYGLSPIQIQLLIFLLTHGGHQCKVGYLASEFNMTRATISDAVKMLVQKKLLARETDGADSRSRLLRLTAEGKKMAGKLSLFAAPLLQTLQKFTIDEKESLLDGLLKLVYNLHEEHILELQRMCYTCNYYSSGEKKGEHYCKLLQVTLRTKDLRIDCPEHEYAVI